MRATRQLGFTYLGMMFAVMLLGVALAATGVLWSTERQREKERELLAIGKEFQRAIGRYYENSPGNQKRYPTKLEELIKDSRYLGTRRYLRRFYADPMTGTVEWGLALDVDGSIMGIYSTSQDGPMKRNNFPDWCEGCVGKSHYSDWKFVYRPDIKVAQSGN